MKKRILIVEDEQDLVAILDYNLTRGGYETSSAGTGSEAIERLSQPPTPDLVILDLMLPDVSGIEVCRWIRWEERTRELPVLMLTARGEEMDRVVGFQVGADDYVVKPFSIQELLLRIEAILRRVGRGAGSSTSEGRGKGQGVDGERIGVRVGGGDGELARERLRGGGVEVDVEGHRVWVGGDEVSLTTLEFDLLVTLMRRRGRAQSRDRLLQDVWGVAPELSTRTVDTHIKRLREKLQAAAVSVETVRGVGYRFSEE